MCMYTLAVMLEEDNNNLTSVKGKPKSKLDWKTVALLNASLKGRQMAKPRPQSHSKSTYQRTGKGC